MENQYKCSECKKYYKSYQSVWHHKNRYHKTDIPILSPKSEDNIDLYTQNIPILSHKKTDKDQCDFCNKKLSSYKNLNRHIKTCKNKNIIIQENENLKKELSDIKKVLLEIMNKKCKMHPKQLQKINNMISQNNNNTINTQNNNQININIIELGNEEISYLFSEKEKISILKKAYGSLEELIKKVHLNKKFPQFQNIIITNIRNNQAYIYSSELGKFILCDKNSLLEDLIEYRFDDLIGFYDEYKDKLEPRLVEKLESMFDLKHDDNYIDRKSKEFNVLIYNGCNKDLLKIKHEDDELTV
jgi:hypothetical protein